jgi:hypothetical protein
MQNCQCERGNPMGLFSRNKERKELKQQLDEKAEFNRLYIMQLLFDDKPIKPTATVICEELKKNSEKLT